MPRYGGMVITLGLNMPAMRIYVRSDSGVVPSGKKIATTTSAHWWRTPCSDTRQYSVKKSSPVRIHVNGLS